MGKTVIVTEKPSVAMTYAQVLGVNAPRNDGYIENDQYIITWCVGHLVGMCYPEKYDEEYKTWKMEDLPFIPAKYMYEPLPNTVKQFNVIKQIYNRPDIQEILYAGDSGREGLYIQVLVRMLAGHNPNATERVVWIDSQTADEIRKGIREAKPLSYYKNMADSGYMRAIEDYSLGINLSRALTCKFQEAFHMKASINVGRVMTCVLGMVVAREREIINFKATEYHKIHSRINLGGEYLEAEWKTDNPTPNMYSNNGFLRREDAENFVKSLERKITIESAEITNEKKYAPLLFNLAELQATCSRLLHISPDETLAIAQTLYEQKLTTYPRTDARVLSTAVAMEIGSNIAGLRGHSDQQIASIAGKIITMEPEKIANSKYVDDSKISDHYAIIPTGQFLDKLPALNQNELFVYNLIVKRFLSIFMPPATYKKIKIVENTTGQRFYASGSTLIDPGFMHLAGIPKNSSNLPVAAEQLQKGQVFDAQFGIFKGETTPPSRYTSGSMVLAMENAGNLIEDEELRAQIKSQGIGTSATRAEVIKKLDTIGYLSVNKKTQIITPEARGYIVHDIVDMIVPEMLNPKMTANWEKELEHIAKGSLDAGQYKEKLHDYVRNKVQEIKDYQITPEFKERIMVYKDDLPKPSAKKKTVKVQTYLNVPFEEKDTVKALGAYFDMNKKLWFVPEGKDVTPFKKWVTSVKTVKKIYLKVPFDDKDKVKSLGAKWSPEKKCWYITNLMDQNIFKQWI